MKGRGQKEGMYMTDEAQIENRIWTMVDISQKISELELLHIAYGADISLKSLRM
jgi:hypothetical protein